MNLKHENFINLHKIAQSKLMKLERIFIKKMELILINDVIQKS